MQPVRAHFVESDAALQNAAGFLERIALGPIATSIAVIAVASVGLLMLNGSIHQRRAARVLLGCFIVFGAPSIADALLRLAAGASTRHVQIDEQSIVPPAPPRPPPPALPQYDPYAGASVPTR